MKFILCIIDFFNDSLKKEVSEVKVIVGILLIVDNQLESKVYLIFFVDVSRLICFFLGWLMIRNFDKNELFYNFIVWFFIKKKKEKQLLRYGLQFIYKGVFFIKI